MFVSLFYISLLISASKGAPLARDATSPTSGWVSDPNGRGTAGLMISCLLTLGLCVWSAMHLNIPPKGETPIQYWTRSLKWVVLGVLIPELVVLSAWRQWLSARRMNTELTTILRENKAYKSQPRRYEWTIAHSYYAGMGGFVIDKDSLPGDAIFESPERLTLTASGVLLLAQCGHLPDIDKEWIWDKSKADGLAKALVLLQAGWMIIQILGRLAVHQPITLLEVNTVGHIFCAFIIYALWWKKPKEVYAPTVLEGPWTRSIAAYMYMSSRISGCKPTGPVTLNAWIKPEFAELAWYPDIVVESRQQSQTINNDDMTQAEQNSSEKGSSKRKPTVKEIPEAYFPIPTGEIRRRPSHTVTALPSTVIHPVMSVEDGADYTLKARWTACAEAINTYPPISKLFHVPENRSSSPWLKPTLAQLVTTTATNWPSDFYLPGMSGELMGMALWLSSSMYGGIHIAAWSDYFPTDIERFLWRFSATYIASSGAFWLVLCVVAFRWPWASLYWDRFIELRARKIEYAVLGFGATVCGVAYVFARVFLVVDAVVSLRKLPNAAYDTPDWTSLFPHL